MTKTAEVSPQGQIQVWDFDIWPLEIICYLGFVVWDFQYFKAHYFITLSEA
jgi:hypothetical protein